MIVAYYFASVSAMTVLWWIENDGRIDAKTMAKYIDRWGLSHWHTLEQERFDQHGT